MNVLKISALLMMISIFGCNKNEDEFETSVVVASADPSDNSTGVSRNKEISFTFNEEIDPATINSSTFMVMNGSAKVDGTLSYSDKTVRFKPLDLLHAATMYTVSITTGIETLTGKSLENNSSWSFTTGGSVNALAGVDLGAAGNYVILAKTAINNNATSVVTGDLGLSPAATSYITGFALTDATGYATSAQITGKVYAADMAAPTPDNMTTAVGNMITAYNDAAGRPSPDFIELGTGNLGGKTLLPGLYKWTGNVTIPSDVTISGDANAVWIFQISGNFSISAAKKIILNSGAQAKNIFWQIAGQATVGTTAHVEGNLLSMTGITFQTGASLTGRALAQTAVILDANALVKP